MFGQVSTSHTGEDDASDLNEFSDMPLRFDSLSNTITIMVVEVIPVPPTDDLPPNGNIVPKPSLHHAIKSSSFAFRLISFYDFLTKEFLLQFINRVVHTKRLSDLMLIFQGDHESLRDYINHFNRETTQIEGLVPEGNSSRILMKMNLKLSLNSLLKVNHRMNADDSNCQKKWCFNST
ncbi:hypothetical protein ACLOJK_012164 [Asimina triloba]